MRKSLTPHFQYWVADSIRPFPVPFPIAISEYIVQCHIPLNWFYTVVVGAIVGRGDCAFGPPATTKEKNLTHAKANLMVSV